MRQQEKRVEQPWGDEEREKRESDECNAEGETRGRVKTVTTSHVSSSSSPLLLLAAPSTSEDAAPSTSEDASLRPAETSGATVSIMGSAASVSPASAVV